MLTRYFNFASLHKDILGKREMDVNFAHKWIVNPNREKLLFMA